MREAAIEVQRQRVAASAGNPGLRRRLAELLRDAGRLNEAEAVLREAVLLFPRNARIQAELDGIVGERSAREALPSTAMALPVTAPEAAPDLASSRLSSVASSPIASGTGLPGGAAGARAAGGLGPDGSKPDVSPPNDPGLAGPGRDDRGPADPRRGAPGQKPFIPLGQPPVLSHTEQWSAPGREWIVIGVLALVLGGLWARETYFGAHSRPHAAAPVAVVPGPGVPAPGDPAPVDPAHVASAPVDPAPASPPAPSGAVAPAPDAADAVPDYAKVPPPAADGKDSAGPAPDAGPPAPAAGSAAGPAVGAPAGAPAGTASNPASTGVPSTPSAASLAPLPDPVFVRSLPAAPSQAAAQASAPGADKVGADKVGGDTAPDGPAQIFILYNPQRVGNDLDAKALGDRIRSVMPTGRAVVSVSAAAGTVRGGISYYAKADREAAQALSARIGRSYGPVRRMPSAGHDALPPRTIVIDIP